MESLKFGLIGLDTSHVIAFTDLLNDKSKPYHVPGGRVVAGYPGGSPDFDLSINRVEGFTKQLREQHGVQICDSPEAVAQQCDAILLTAVDGRAHRDLFAKIAPFGKPTFIDKPLAVSSADARAIYDLAQQHGVMVWSSSSLRFAQPLVEALGGIDRASIVGFDGYGPMAIQATQPGLFWYGVHTVDMVFAALGKGCRTVQATTTADHDVIVGQWEDGRIGTVRGLRAGKPSFGAVIHHGDGHRYVAAYDHAKPPYAGLLEHIIEGVRGGKPGVAPEETIQVIRFMEAANQSRETGERVTL